MKKTKVIVGLGSCGIAAGASKTYSVLEEILAKGEMDFELARTSCIGMCYNEPLVEIQDEKGKIIYGDMTAESV